METAKTVCCGVRRNLHISRCAHNASTDLKASRKQRARRERAPSLPRLHHRAAYVLVELSRGSRALGACIHTQLVKWRGALAQSRRDSQAVSEAIMLCRRVGARRSAELTRDERTKRRTAHEYVSRARLLCTHASV